MASEENVLKFHGVAFLANPTQVTEVVHNGRAFSVPVELLNDEALPGGRRWAHGPHWSAHEQELVRRILARENAGDEENWHRVESYKAELHQEYKQVLKRRFGLDTAAHFSDVCHGCKFFWRECSNLGIVLSTSVEEDCENEGIQSCYFCERTYCDTAINRIEDTHPFMACSDCGDEDGVGEMVCFWCAMKQRRRHRLGEDEQYCPGCVGKHSQAKRKAAEELSNRPLKTQA